MKVFNTVTKIVVALAAVAGAVYLAAAYGDKIVAWAKKMLNSCPCCKNAEEAPAEETVEEAPVEAAEVEAEAEPEVEVEITVEEGEPVAEEHEFEA